MTNSEIRALLKANTNMSDFDIERHINDGVIVYENFEDYKNECLANLCDEEDIEEMWKNLDEMKLEDGKIVRVDFIL